MQVQAQAQAQVQHSPLPTVGLRYSYDRHRSKQAGVVFIKSDNDIQQARSGALIMFEEGLIEISQANERYKILEIAKAAVCGCSWKRSRIGVLGEDAKRGEKCA